MWKIDRSRIALSREKLLLYMLHWALTLINNQVFTIEKIINIRDTINIGKDISANWIKKNEKNIPLSISFKKSPVKHFKT